MRVLARETSGALRHGSAITRFIDVDAQESTSQRYGDIRQRQGRLNVVVNITTLVYAGQR
jgi:hypothetical protein